jgi:hypothetical protein
LVACLVDVLHGVRKQQGEGRRQSGQEGGN